MSDSLTPTDPSLASLTHFVDHPDLLADHTMSSVEWEAVEVLMPRILRGKSKEDVKQLLLAEIDGMSKKRLMAVLAGETLEESSSSEEEEEEIVEDVVEEMMNGLEETGEENEHSLSKETSEDASEKASVEPVQKMEKQAAEASPEPMNQQGDGKNNDGEVSEEGEIRHEESDRSMTPPDPSPSVPERISEEVDSDEDDFDRQLDRDLEDVI
ncbi:unnamed protein product [Caenorhabditis brenneri]